MKGWVKFHRRYLSSDLWLAEKFTKGQAWVDLFSLANHKDKSIWIRGVEVKIKRGQLAWSELSLSERWSWSRNKVRRFLKWLKTEQQIEQQKTNVTSLISIVNYDLYQVCDTPNDTPERHQKDTRRYTNKNEENEENEENTKDSLQKTTFAGQPDKEPEFYLTYKKRKISGKRLETFLLFWDAFGDKRSKATATDSWLEIPSLTDVLVSKIVDAAKIYSKNRKSLKDSGATPKMAQGWLSSRRWEDEQVHEETPEEYAIRRGLN